MVFVPRQLQERCRQQNKGVYVTFVDLNKAFNTVAGKGYRRTWSDSVVPLVFSAWSSSCTETNGFKSGSTRILEPFSVVSSVKSWKMTNNPFKKTVRRWPNIRK